MTEYELGSDEFFNHYYPRAKESTRDIYRRLITNLQLWQVANPGKDVGLWLEEKNGNYRRWVERFTFLRKFNNVYWTFDAVHYNKEYLRLLLIRKDGENMTTSVQNSTPVLLETFGDLDSRISRMRSGPIGLSSLFGCWLPPRRWDGYQVVIRSSDTSDKINYYNKSTNMFVFNNYKNAKTKNVQKFGILRLLPLYENPNDLYRVVEYLNGLPDGPICPSLSNLDKRIKKWYGCCNNILRKYWETKFSKGTRQQKIVLADWMDHSPTTALMYYTVDPDIQSEPILSDMVIEEPLGEVSPEPVTTVVLEQQSVPIDQPKSDKILLELDQNTYNAIMFCLKQTAPYLEQMVLASVGKK